MSSIINSQFKGPKSFVQFNAECPEVLGFTLNSLIDGQSYSSGDSVEVCGADNFPYQFSIVGAVPTYSFKLKAPDGSIIREDVSINSSLISGSINAADYGSGVYTIEVLANSQNCPLMASFNITVVGTILPSVSVNSPLCSGGAIVAEFQSGGVTSGMEIFYNVDNGPQQTAAVPSGTTSVVVNIGAAVSTSVINITGYQYPSGCAINLNPIISQTVEVVTAPTITGSASNSPICLGQDAIITLTGTPNAVGLLAGVSFQIGAGGTVDVTLPSGSLSLGSNNLSITNLVLGDCAGSGSSLSITVVNGPTITNVTTECSDDFSTYDILFDSTVGLGDLSTVPASTITSLGGGSFKAADIPIANNVVITADGVDCDVTEAVAPPTCNCADIDPPTGIVTGSFCEGSGDDVTISVDGLVDHTVIWENFSGTQVGSGNSFTALAPIESVSYYARYVLDSNANCKSTRVQVGITKLLRPSVQDGNINACDGNNVTISVGTINDPNNCGSGGFTYSWTGPNGFTSSASSFTIPANGTTAGDYILTVTDCQGCSSLPATFTLNSDCCMNITTQQSILRKTEGNDVVLQTTVLNGVSDYDWTLTGPGGFSQSGSQAGSVISYTIPNAVQADSGTYTYTVTDANGCVDTGTITVQVLDYTISVGAFDCGTATLPISVAPVAPTTISDLNNVQIPVRIDGSIYGYLTAGALGFPESNPLDVPLNYGQTYSILVGNSPGETFLDGSYTVPQCCALVINSITPTGAICVGGNGSIVIDASGESPLQYSIGGGWQTSDTFASVAPGTYTVSVRDGDNNACIVSQAGVTVGAGTPVNVAFTFGNLSEIVSIAGGVRWDTIGETFSNNACCNLARIDVFYTIRFYENVVDPGNLVYEYSSNANRVNSIGATLNPSHGLDTDCLTFTSDGQTILATIEYTNITILNNPTGCTISLPATPVTIPAVNTLSSTDIRNDEGC